MPKSNKREPAAVLEALAALYPDHPLDVKHREPLRILIATMLSARTKDPVTNAAMQRLWARASTPQALLALAADEIAALIKPVGFYQQKAQHVHGLWRMLLEDFGGVIPDTREELMRLPGVGRKTANLVLNICFDYPAICVDTHVHRISNRLGWVETATPEETEMALMARVPQKYWAMLNRVLVNHGQRVCDPVSPKCSGCPIADLCPRVGVAKSR
jgi:endonuclease III